MNKSEYQVEIRSKPVIIFDVDGVLGDLHAKIIARHNLEFPQTPFSLEMIKHWKFSECTPHYESVYSWFYEKDFFGDIPVYDGAAFWTKELSKYYNLYAVTSTPENSQAARLAWMRRNFPWFTATLFAKTGQKHHFFDPDEVYAFVDDALDNFRHRAAQLMILWEYPWSKSFNDIDHAIDVRMPRHPKIDRWQKLYRLLLDDEA